MDVANLELCKELYSRSGWRLAKGSHAKWVEYADGTSALWLGSNPIHFDEVVESYPAYSLGFLLRELPAGQRVVKLDDRYYVANNVQGLTDINADGKTPEDAVADFAIYLFKKGILKRKAN